MRSWRVARSLGGAPTEGLLGEINAAAPHRTTVADGAIGDAAHARRQSDHNPCRCCGVVCARDFTHDPKRGFDSYAFAEWLRRRVLAGESRVAYVISNGRIFSGHGEPHPVGEWRPYRGKNKHAHHVHVSVRHGEALYDDARPWAWHPAPADAA
jgi:hypothetical protein